MARVEYYKKSKKSSWFVFGGLLGALLLIVSSIFLLFYPFASSEKKVYFEGKNPILFNGHQRGNGLLEGNTLYVPLSFLKKQIDSSILYDEKSQSVIITTKDKVVQMPIESMTYFVNDKPAAIKVPPAIKKGGAIFIALDPLLSFYPIQYKKLPETEAIWIQRNGEEYQNGRLTDEDVNGEKIRLRTEPSWRSPYVAEMSKSEAVTIEAEKKDFFFVRKANGIGGYIKKEYVRSGETIKVVIDSKSKPFQLPKIAGPIHLTWEAVYTKNPDSSKIPVMNGVNTVSPTWFSLAGSDGAVTSRASLEYSNWAQAKGYQVWGLFSNSFDPKLTHEALTNFDTRKNIIHQLLQYCKMYHLQGINFDIENVNPEDGPLVTQLLREAAPYLHEAGLFVSMDITFAAGENNNWSSFYEREKLAQIADYLIVMAYDEHTAGSDAGSVASLPWVEGNLQILLKDVPNEKLILGVPLYARLWKEQPNANGGTDVTAQALSMDKVKIWLKEKALQPVYDEKSGQNYAEFFAENENATYKIWIEDELSLKKRADLAVKYKLAGVASWSRMFGDQTAWAALDLSSYKNLTKK